MKNVSFNFKKPNGWDSLTEQEKHDVLDRAFQKVWQRELEVAEYELLNGTSSSWNNVGIIHD